MAIPDKEEAGEKYNQAINILKNIKTPNYTSMTFFN